MLASPALTAFIAPSGPALRFAGKTLLAGGIALWLSFRLDLEQPQWALMTVFIVSQPLSGMVVAKGLFRLLGTLVGTSMAVLIMALFAQTPWLFLLVVALWMGLCTAASTLLRNHVSYAFVLSGYTVAIIALPAINVPLQVFDQAVARCTEICLGIVCASVVSATLWPQRVEGNLARVARETLDAALQAAANALRGQAREPEGIVARPDRRRRRPARPRLVRRAPGPAPRAGLAHPVARRAEPAAHRPRGIAPAAGALARSAGAAATLDG